MQRTSIAARILSAAILSAVFVTSAGFAAPQRRARRPPEQRIVPQDGLDAAGPDVADPAPDLLLTDLEGKEVQLSDLWSQGALVLVLGSATSLEFRKTAASLQHLAGRQVGQAQVVLVYTREAQPSGVPGPFPDLPAVPAGEFARVEAASVEERRDYARFTAAKLKLTPPLQVLVDGMDDAAWNSYGPAPNNAFVIDRHGSVVGRLTWFDDAGTDQFLRGLRAREKRLPEPSTASEADAKTKEGGQR